MHPRPHHQPPAPHRAHVIEDDRRFRKSSGEFDQFVGTSAGSVLAGLLGAGDEFALGVCLYELLTGVHPFARRVTEHGRDEAALSQVRRPRDAPVEDVELDEETEEEVRAATATEMESVLTLCEARGLNPATEERMPSTCSSAVWREFTAARN